MKKKPRSPSDGSLPKKAVLLAVLVTVCVAIIPLLRAVARPDYYIKSAQDQLVLEIPYIDRTTNEADLRRVYLVRAGKVELVKRGSGYSTVRYNDTEVEVPNSALVQSVEETLDFDYAYPVRRSVLYLEKNGTITSASAKRGEELQVVSIREEDLNRETGEIAWVQVAKDGKTYYIKGENVQFEPVAQNESAASLELNVSQLPEAYQEDDGESYLETLDFTGETQPEWIEEVLPESFTGVHMSLYALMSHMDTVLSLAEKGEISAVMIALKGAYGLLAYQSAAASKFYSPYDTPLMDHTYTMEQVQEAVQKLKDAGLYVAARLETFNDPALASVRNDLAITNSQGYPVIMTDSYWVSPYSREVWQYHADLAAEAASLGFEEVEFDFCRFPEGTGAEETGLYDFHNDNNETKAEAISAFLSTMRETLEPLHVVTSAAALSGPLFEHYDYQIGQYYPAMLVAPNVLSPMLYIYTLDPLLNFGKNAEQELAQDFTKEMSVIEPLIENEAYISVWITPETDNPALSVKKQIAAFNEQGYSRVWIWTDEGDAETLETLFD